MSNRNRTSVLVPLILVKNDGYFLPYALNCIKGRFSRYVIYDIGSEDNTEDILRWFIESEEKEADIFSRFLPHCDPKAQGSFRNAMFAEARSDWVFILDGDEVYSELAMDKLIESMADMRKVYEESKGQKIYGVCRRREFAPDLTSAYDRLRGHHRVYHRTAIFTGSHPGEDPLVTQDERTEHSLSRLVICNHFHNTQRSRFDNDVPSRIRRRDKQTYHPGTLTDFNLLVELPALENPILTFPQSAAVENLRFYNGQL